MMTLGTLRTRPDWCNSFFGDMMTVLGGTKCAPYTVEEVRKDQEEILRTKTCVNAADPEACVQGTLRSSDAITKALDPAPAPGEAQDCELQAKIDHPFMSSILGTSYYCSESESSPLRPYLIGGAAILALLLITTRRR